MATLEKEDFWGCELKKGSVEVKFNPEFEDSELSEVEHKLILSQACLGAKSSGRCLVEVTAHDYKGDEMKNVIVSLQQGATEMCPLNLSFNPPATFKLIEGSGPVYLSGNHIQSLAEDELDSSEESDEDEDEAPQLVESKAAVKSKRPLPASTPSGPPKKMAKTNKEDEEEDDDEEDESSDEEDEEEEEEEPAKPAKTKKDDKKGKANDDDDDDDDEDDMEYEEDDDDEDSDEDEDSEEGSDEEESESDEEESDEVTKTLTGKKASAKTPMTNGISSKKEDKKTPSKSQQKTPQPKTDKPKDLDSIKKALLKSPSLPKKIDKFKNFMRSSYKITDEGTVKDVWEYIQNNKK